MTVKSPNFKLISTSNEVVELNKIKSKLIVLYFYPKDDTPGCTLETMDFNNLLSKFSKIIAVFTVYQKIVWKVIKNLKKNIKLNLIYSPMKKRLQ